MKIIFVIGTRPNIVKIAPLIRAIRTRFVEWKLVHVGQHYDYGMSKVFLDDLDISYPNANLGVGSGTHAEQIAMTMMKFEEYCLKEKPDTVVVVGDVNSSLGCALAVSKLKGIKLAHVEAGCRAYDESFEEINRVLIDRVSDYLFCPSEIDRDCALDEGIYSCNCHVVGDVAVDTLLSVLPKVENIPSDEPYALLTLHRPANVDNKDRLHHILEIINEVSKEIRVVFPIHPRTSDRIKSFDLSSFIRNLDHLITYSSLGYLKFIKLLKSAKMLLTDSGGLQLEAHVLKVPCLTLDSSTAHTETISCNANTLVGTDRDLIMRSVRAILSGNSPSISDGAFWDGKVAERIIKQIV